MRQIILRHTGAAALATFFLYLFGACGGASKTAAKDAADGDDAATLVDAASPDAPDCPASCDDNNACTVDSCDPETHLCVHAAVANGTACEDGSACTVGDICQDGLCFSGPFKICKALDQCHIAGVCSPKTGECTNPIASAANTPCSDGVNCTTGDQCANGVCVGTPITCDGISVCDESDGVCKLPGGGAAFPTASLAAGFDNVEWSDSSSGPDGSVFLTGLLKGPSDLGTGPLVTGMPNNVQILLARLDPTTGKTLWSEAIGDPSDLQQRLVKAVAANGTGQVAILGPLSTINVFGTQVAAIGVGDAYILGADAATGSPLWLRGSPIPAGDISGLVNDDRINLGKDGELTSLAGDPSSDALVFCGTIFQKAITGKLLAANPYTIVHHGGSDVVLASISGKTGSPSWLQQIGGTNDETCAKVTVDATGNIYVAGTYTYGSSIAFDGLPPLPLVDRTGLTNGMFLAKLDKDGKPLWARGFWSPSAVTGKSRLTPTVLTTTPDGVAVGGGLDNFADLGGVPFKYANAGAFLAKFDANTGAGLWVSEWGTNSSYTPAAISGTSSGNLLIVGSYIGSFTLGAIALQQTTSSGAYVAKLDVGTGAFLNARGYAKSAVEDDRLFGIAVNRGGAGVEKDASLLFGAFSKTIDFGAPLAPLTSTSTNPAAFIAKLVP